MSGHRVEAVEILRRLGVGLPAPTRIYLHLSIAKHLNLAESTQSQDLGLLLSEGKKYSLIITYEDFTKEVVRSLDRITIEKRINIIEMKESPRYIAVVPADFVSPGGAW